MNWESRIVGAQFIAPDLRRHVLGRDGLGRDESHPYEEHQGARLEKAIRA